MTLKNTKTILFASLIVAMILPFSGIQFIEAKSNTDYDKLSSQIDKEINKLVKQSEKLSNDSKKLAKLNDEFAEKKLRIIIKYQEKLNDKLGKLLGQGFTDMSTNQRSEMINYIISEKFKIPMQEKFISDMTENNTIVNSVCDTQPDVIIFKQLNVDITGQIGFEGNNDLETVQRNDLSSCLREYTLTFTDEDHPISYIDVNYDIWRLYEYGRIQDVETFYVSNDDVWFLDSGSGTQTFWILGIPNHQQDVNSFSDTVYVSNTWNHLMDTSNTNSGADIKTWYK